MVKQAIIEVCMNAEAEARAILDYGSDAVLSFNMKEVTVASIKSRDGNNEAVAIGDEIVSAEDDIRVLVFRVGS